LKNQRVYLFSGILDSVVRQGVMEKLSEYYLELDENIQIKEEFNISAEHCQPTNFFGKNCSFLGSPYINECNYDGAGNALNWLYNNTLEPPTTMRENNILKLNQSEFTPKLMETINTSNYTLTGLAEYAFVYIPSGCKNNTLDCDSIHISFHGCSQSYVSIGNDYYLNAGYNPWAESNNIIVLYPQAAPVPVTNPLGCWDWWGFTGTTYPIKIGYQMSTIYNMLKYIQTNKL